MLEDKLLVVRCKRGSSSALGRIYEKYKDDLLILAIALLNDTSAAEDILHDVFIRFVQGIEDFELTGSLKAYLTTCVVNRVRNSNRAKQPQSVELDNAVAVSSNSDAPVKSVICNEQLQRLASAMAALAYQQREVIILHLQAEMRFRAIADSQGISVNTVKSRYRYGLNKLRSLLNSEVEK